MKLSRTYHRIDWDGYFKKITEDVALRANCRTRQTGAILVRDKMIIATGYNGTPKGIKNCYQGGCPRCNDDKIKSGQDLDKCICVHAEENALLQSAYNGMSTQGAMLYTIFCPCIFCAKSIINAGIKEVIYFDNYYSMDGISAKMFKEVGIKVRKLASSKRR